MLFAGRQLFLQQATQHGPEAKVRGRGVKEWGSVRSRAICPGGVGFETSSAKGGRGAVLVANLTRAGVDGGERSRDWHPAWPSIRKAHDKHVNANGDFFPGARLRPGALSEAQDFGRKASFWLPTIYESMRVLVFVLVLGAESSA